MEWIIPAQDGTEWIKGGGLVPGDKINQHTYRSEIAGQEIIAIILQHIVLPHSTNTSIITVCGEILVLQQV